MKVKLKDEAVRDMWIRLIVTGIALAFLLGVVVVYLMDGGRG